MFKREVIHVLAKALQVGVVLRGELRHQHGVRVERHLVRVEVVLGRLFEMRFLLLQSAEPAVAIPTRYLVSAVLVHESWDGRRGEVVAGVLLETQLAQSTYVLEETVFFLFVVVVVERVVSCRAHWSLCSIQNCNDRL